MALWMLVGFACPDLALAAHAAPDVPRLVPNTAFGAPLFAPDRIVIQLTPAASRAAFVRAPLGGTRRTRLGVPGLDGLLAVSPGTWLEQEFRGDEPPAIGSEATDFSAFYLVHLPDGASTGDALPRFRGLGEVREAHEIGLAPVTSMPNDSLWSLAYHLYQPSRKDIHALEAWDLTLGDTSQVVALIDTGLLPYHPDISGTTAGSSGQIWTNWAEVGGIPGVDDDHNGFVDDVHGWDFVQLADGTDGVPGEDVMDEDNDPNDFVGHGTGVAGLIGALSDNVIGVTGTAQKVRIMPLRVGWSSVRQPAGIVDMSYVAQAVRYATKMRVNVINVSLSNTNEPDLEVAVGAALDSNIVVVVAAGNNGTPNGIGGRFPHAIVVAATDRNDVVPIWSSRASFVDLAAPGDLVPTTILYRPGTDSLGLRQPSYVPDASGTSFSTPIVSGAVALVQARRHELSLPPLPPALMDLLLRSTTDDISAENPGLTGYGTGRLDMSRAVSSGQKIHFAPLFRIIGPGVMFSTNAGTSRIAYMNEGGQILFLDPNAWLPARHQIASATRTTALPRLRRYPYTPGPLRARTSREREVG